MISEYNARNARSLSQLINNEDVEILSFPRDVLNQLEKLTHEVIEELIARDAQSAKVWSSYQGFMSQSKGWLRISEKSYLAI
jgi:TRAP-type mannitol/chloroaromatic compound transport system substrate-binding protein